MYWISCLYTILCVCVILMLGSFFIALLLFFSTLLWNSPRIPKTVYIPTCKCNESRGFQSNLGIPSIMLIVVITYKGYFLSEYLSYNNKPILLIHVALLKSFFGSLDRVNFQIFTKCTMITTTIVSDSIPLAFITKKSIKHIVILTLIIMSLLFIDTITEIVKFVCSNLSHFHQLVIWGLPWCLRK